MGDISARQLEVIRVLARKKGPAEWGEVWDGLSWGDMSSPLQMPNFDRVTGALERKGLVAYDTDNLVSITAAGRAIYDADLADRLRRLHCPECHKQTQSPCPCACHQPRVARGAKP